MGTLNAALAWAARGFRVFPLQENTREPALAGVDWHDLATTDPSMLRDLWTDPVLRTEHNYNIGCVCTDYVVVDIDVKNGKKGYEEYVAMGGTFDTLVVQTTSGGYHLYFHGPDSSNAPLSNGVDIRSHRGYVVAPGSVIDGKPYVVVSERDLSWIPEPIERRLAPPYVRKDLEVSLELIDNAANVEAGRRFVESAPVAVEGQRGDETTFITAARLVREMALSVDTAFCLLRDHWNDRCSPPWELGELYQKVQNAAAYGSADLAALSPETLFAKVEVIAPPPSVFEQASISWGNAIMPATIQPRPWVVDRLLMKGAVTLLLAAGSAGKSSVSIALAAHLALGLDFAGFKAKYPCKTIIYNGEDDLAEQSRRLLAVCLAYQFDYNKVKENVLLLSSNEIKLNLVEKEFNKPVRNDVLVKHLTEIAAAEDVGLLILDPLVRIHKCDEGDNVQMDFVMETLTDIARNGNIALLALHHTSKGGSNDDRAGNMDSARGASAIVNAARIAFTLLNASSNDCEDYDIKPEDRNIWVRLDDAKMNLALANLTATWFKKDGVRIVSGDMVGVLKHTPLTKSKVHIKVRLANLLIENMTATGSGSMTMKQAVAVIKAGESILANKTEIELRRQIEGFFTTPVEFGGRRLHAVRDPEKQDKITIAMS